MKNSCYTHCILSQCCFPSNFRFILPFVCFYQMHSTISVSLVSSSLCVSSESGSCCCWRPSPESAPLCLMISPPRNWKKTKKKPSRPCQRALKLITVVISLYELSERVRFLRDLSFVCYRCFILNDISPSMVINLGFVALSWT